jgi:hypothetical protein
MLSKRKGMFLKFGRLIEMNEDDSYRMTYITLPCVVCGPSFREFTKRMTKRMKKTRKKKSCQIIVPSILLCSYQLPQMPCL